MFRRNSFSKNHIKNLALYFHTIRACEKKKEHRHLEISVAFIYQNTEVHHSDQTECWEREEEKNTSTCSFGRAMKAEMCFGLMNYSRYNLQTFFVNHGSFLMQNSTQQSMMAGPEYVCCYAFEYSKRRRKKQKRPWQVEQNDATPSKAKPVQCKVDSRIS